MMAEVLDSYDKIDHPKVQFGDWEALSIHEADSRGSEDDSSQSGLERDNRTRSFRDAHDGSTAQNGYKNPDAGFQSGGGTRKPYTTTSEAGKEDEDGVDSTKSQPSVSIYRYSVSSNAGSTTSSLVESPTSISFPPSPTNPTSTVAADTAKPGVRFTDRGPPLAVARRPMNSRRSSANTVPMACEWGILFDEKGYATFRNGQFLRGLAKHIIDDFASNSSNLVVTPEKLSVFYSKYRLDSEICPFLEIFNSRARDINSRIANFFDDLSCQYHLIQLDPYSRPAVPALTPTGFVQFFTTCILAYPDEEFRRLDKVVTDVQISLIDTAEKLPRQLIRSQFPVKPDPKSKKVLADALDNLLFDSRFPGPATNSRPPLAILPPQVSSDRRTLSYPGVRHYAAPPEKRYARNDGYAIPATSEETTRAARSRYPPDSTDRERPRSRYEDEPEEYHYKPTSKDVYTPSPRFSSRALLPVPGPSSTPARPPPHARSYSSTGAPPPPPPAPSTAYRRAQSPPPRTYRASAPDVSTSTYYYKPTTASLSPPPPPPPPAQTGRGEHPLANSVTITADPGSRRTSAAELESVPQQQVVLARSSTLPNTNGKAAVVSASSSSQPKPEYSGNSSKRASASSVVLLNAADKKHQSQSQHHHHHRRRRSAVVAVEHDKDKDKDKEKERDRGPTWEEVLKSQGGTSSHHRHHHRTESSGKSGSRGYHRDRSAN